jgi:AraC family transcriptional regulator
MKAGIFMQWSEMFTKENQPTESQIRDFVGCGLWDDLDSHLRQEYNVKPKVSHSSCAMDGGMWKGWNVKYQKSGKSLCTLYPKQGYLQSLVPVSLQDIGEAELMLAMFTEYTQNLFKQSATGRHGMSLAFMAYDEAVLRDMKSLIALRAVKR